MLSGFRACQLCLGQETTIDLPCACMHITLRSDNLCFSQPVCVVTEKTLTVCKAISVGRACTQQLCYGNCIMTECCCACNGLSKCLAVLCRRASCRESDRASQTSGQSMHGRPADWGTQINVKGSQVCSQASIARGGEENASSTSQEQEKHL